MSELSELSDRIRAIADAWKPAFEKGSTSPELWKPHWPLGELTVVDEMVKTLSNMIARERAPAGFGPNFHLARVLANAGSISLQGTMAQLTASQWNYLPTFVAQLTDVLSKVHSMIIFADKNGAETANADSAAKLAQALALLETAQRELADKKRLLDEATASSQAARDLATKMAEDGKAVTAAKDAATAALGEIGTSKTSAAEAAAKAIESRDKAAEVLGTAKTASIAVDTARTDLETLMGDAKEQSKVITSILPKGASAGLAAAFADRGRKLEITKWVWAGIFGGSVIALAVAGYFLTAAIAPGANYWTEMLWRVTKATPLVWLAWVSIIQYGNTVRVQEDYAFKEATSKAFQGYRDHMEHLKNVGGDSSVNALDLMAATTIDILGREPLRIYEKANKDASPAHSFLESIFDKIKPAKKEAGGGA